MLRSAKVQKTLQAAMQARSKRTELSSDRIVAELAKIGFANMRDYWPRPGENIDLHRLDQDHMAAIEEIAIDETSIPLACSAGAPV
jgi:phage terminase small subunit